MTARITSPGYLCAFSCRTMARTETEILLHERSCDLNPGNRTCLTCGYSDPVDDEWYCVGYDQPILAIVRECVLWLPRA